MAAAGILTTIDDKLTLRNINLLQVQNLSHLIRILINKIELRDISSDCDLSIVYDLINCNKLELECLCPLTDEEQKSLTKLLDERVEKFNYSYSPTHKLFPSIQHYEGNGKCNEIDLQYDCWGPNEYELHLSQELDVIEDRDEKGSFKTIYITLIPGQE